MQVNPISKIIFVLVLLCGTRFVASQRNEHSDHGSSGFSVKGLIAKYFSDSNNYLIEAVLVVLLVIYVINYFTGKKLNTRLALKWVQENKELFSSEFSHIGVTDKADGALIDAESANLFKFYASGRRNCYYSLVTLELKKRHDMLSMFIFNIFWPEKDRISIEIPIDVPTALPIVMGIIRKKESKVVFTNHADLKNFCSKMSVDEIQKEYVVYAEEMETVEHVLTAEVLSVLKKYSGTIQMLSLNDQVKPHKLVLKLDMVVPYNMLKNPGEFKTILKMLFYLIDHICEYKMSTACRVKADKQRQFIENQKAKENLKEKNEEIQKKLQEKKKEDPNAKKKDEDKMKKRMQKKFVKVG